MENEIVFLLYALLAAVFLCMVRADFAISDVERVRGLYKLEISDELLTLKVDPNLSYLFIHACVGTFHRKKGNGTWGHGEEILLEMLDTIEASGITPFIGGVFVGLIGKASDRMHAKTAINERTQASLSRSHTTNTAGVTSDSRRVVFPLIQIVIECDDIEVAEFPTLFMAQHFAMKAPADTKIAYIHTKGVRQNGIADFPHEWRRYMMHFLITKYDICFKALNEHHYCTCGALKQGIIYAGNFWWTKATYLATRSPTVASLTWNMNNRYLAEEYLLRDQTVSNSACGPIRASALPTRAPQLDTKWAHLNHYCTHHAHHNMQLCHTPLNWYANISSTILRSSPQCFKRSLLPPHPTKDPHSWCHHNGLPVIL